MEDWTKLCISQDSSIKDAVKIIDQNVQYQIALVIDKKGKLIGTITDGDFRRGALNKISIDMPVSEIMNKNPLTADYNMPIAEQKKLMLDRSLRQIILVNDNNQVQDLHSIDNIDEKPNHVFLMAGGLGSRLMPLTKDIPKPLLKVGGVPILETIISNFVKQGFKKFHIAVNYKAEKIISYFGDGTAFGCNIEYVREDKKLGTAGALSLLQAEQEHPLIVMNGDLLTKVKFQNLIDFHQNSNAIATMGIREYNLQVPFGVVEVENNNLIKISEKPKHKFFINAGVYLLTPEAIRKIPKDKFYDMPSLFQTLKDENNIVSAFPIHEYWLDIGRKDQLEIADKEYMQEFL